MGGGQMAGGFFSSVVGAFPQGLHLVPTFLTKPHCCISLSLELCCPSAGTLPLVTQEWELLCVKFILNSIFHYILDLGCPPGHCVRLLGPPLPLQLPGLLIATLPSKDMLIGITTIIMSIAHSSQ